MRRCVRGEGRGIVAAVVAIACAACTYDVPGVVAEDATTLGDREVPDGAPTHDSSPDVTMDTAVAEVGDAGDSGDSGAASDAHGGTDAGIGCGAGLVCVAPQVCCATYMGKTFSAYACTALDGCGGTPISCDDSNACSVGDLCCGIAAGIPTSMYTSLACQAAGSCTVKNDVFCDPLSSSCMGGLTCTPSTILPGFYYCQ